MNFEVFTTSVELQDIPSYTTNITVEGQLLKLSFMWNERIGKRTLYIVDSTDQCYLQNTILHPNEPFELNTNAVLNDLPYSVTLIKTGNQKKAGNIYNWSKDFILCFSRTVDVEEQKLVVRYGVTKPSTPITTQPFGNWILNQGYEIVENYVRYTAYKTNRLDYYDSFALADLIQCLVKSFHDADLQQYTAFTTAVEQLIGSVDWVLDPVNNQIKYTDPNDVQSCTTPQDCPQYEYLYYNSNRLHLGYFSTIPDAAITIYEDNGWAEAAFHSVKSDNGFEIIVRLNVRDKYTGHVYAQGSIEQVIFRLTNPAYDPTAEEEQKTLPLEVVAQKVISNAESSEDEALKLLSEDYINLVAESIFNADTNKQFVKLDDLIPQLEANKVLRN